MTSWSSVPVIWLWSVPVGFSPPVRRRSTGLRRWQTLAVAVVGSATAGLTRRSTLLRSRPRLLAALPSLQRFVDALATRCTPLNLVARFRSGCDCTRCFESRITSYLTAATLYVSSPKKEKFQFQVIDGKTQKHQSSHRAQMLENRAELRLHRDDRGLQIASQKSTLAYSECRKQYVQIYIYIYTQTRTQSEGGNVSRSGGGRYTLYIVHCISCVKVAVSAARNRSTKGSNIQGYSSLLYRRETFTRLHVGWPAAGAA